MQYMVGVMNVNLLAFLNVSNITLLGTYFHRFKESSVGAHLN